MDKNIKIAILSGKGGTGKTFISTNLAATIPSSAYIDCDVEEPNGELFLKPLIIKEKNIDVRVPVIDKKKCTLCRECVEFCRYNALAVINNEVKVFEDICHSCNGCKVICPSDAISNKTRTIGKIKEGKKGNITFRSGTLFPGETSGVPIINSLLSDLEKIDKNYTFIDCAPGTACNVIESIKEADYCLLIAEPTIFGVHNLQMIHELTQIFNKPYSVILNKSLEGKNPAGTYCIKNNIPITGYIPFDSKIAEINSKGKLLVKEDEKYKDFFSEIVKKIEKELSI